MTVKNFRAQVVNSTVYCTWSATETFSFLYIDAESEPVLAPGQTEWSGPFIQGAIYQAVDSATTSPVPASTEKVPMRYITLFWDEITGAARYEVAIDAVTTSVTAGQASYSFRSQRLASGSRTFSIVSIDAAGNKSTIDALTFTIEDVPNPVQSLVLTQSGAGNITATIVAPVGF